MVGTLRLKTRKTGAVMYLNAATARRRCTGTRAAALGVRTLPMSSYNLMTLSLEGCGWQQVMPATYIVTPVHTAAHRWVVMAILRPTSACPGDSNLPASLRRW